MEAEVEVYLDIDEVKEKILDMDEVEVEEAVEAAVVAVAVVV